MGGHLRGRVSALLGKLADGSWNPPGWNPPRMVVPPETVRAAIEHLRQLGLVREAPPDPDSDQFAVESAPGGSPGSEPREADSRESP